MYTISPFIKASNSLVHEQYLARKCFPFLQWHPPLKQMHLSKQFFLTNLYIEVLLLSAKTTNGLLFVFSYTSFVWYFFLLPKKSVANALVAFVLFFLRFHFLQTLWLRKKYFCESQTNIHSSKRRIFLKLFRVLFEGF